MSLEDNKYYKVYKKNEKFLHFIEGVCIIALLLIIWITYFQSNQLQEEIRENCGWGEEDYECYCERGEALAMKAQLENENDMEFELGIG